MFDLISKIAKLIHQHFDDDEHSDDEDYSKQSRMKLRALEIKEFDGSSDRWTKWKHQTEYTLTSTGYGEILSDSGYALDHGDQNAMVFGQLSAACIDGTAHHLVFKHEDDRNGHGAWNELVSWYDGDLIKTEKASKI